MSKREDALRKAKRWKTEHLDGVPVVTCDSTGSTAKGADIRVNGSSNKLWVKRGEYDPPFAVWANGKFLANDSRAGSPLRIAKNGSGEWEIIGGDSLKSDIFFGAASITELFARLIGELLKLVIPGKNLGPGRLILTSDSTGLKVTLEPFWYTTSDNRLRKWRGESSGSFTRTMPGSNTHRWSFVEFNPDNAIFNVQTSTPVSITFPIQSDSERIAVIEAFTPTPGMLPCWALYERTGMTTLDFESGIEDVRLWLSTSSQGGGSSGWTVDYDALVPPGRDFNVVGAVNITSGTLTVEGELYII